MLNKIVYFNSNCVVKADMSKIISAFRRYYEEKENTVEIFADNIAKGTLGVFFLCTIAGHEYFVKTHLDDENCRKSLIKESRLLKSIYQDEMVVDFFDIEIEGKAQTYLIMDRLDKVEGQISIQELKVVLQNCYRKLKKVDLESIEYKIEQLVEEAEVGLKELSKNNFFSSDIIWNLQLCIQYIKQISKERACLVCHGDLSNVNIMKHNDNYIILDWEDAFVGFEPYDIAYWMTFFQQRKNYNSTFFIENGLNTEDNKWLMIFVMLLKCWLSYKNKAYLNDSLTFQQRIEEVLNLYDSMGDLK